MKVFGCQEEAPRDGCALHTGLPCGVSLHMEGAEGGHCKVVELITNEAAAE